MPIKDIPTLAFDHNIIIRDSLQYIRQYLEANPCLMFELLPRKFTIAQLRLLHEVIYRKKIDNRNFYKRIIQVSYIVPLDEYETNVAHRAARYYKFDKVIYNKSLR